MCVRSLLIEGEIGTLIISRAEGNGKRSRMSAAKGILKILETKKPAIATSPLGTEAKTTSGRSMAAIIAEKKPYRRTRRGLIVTLERESKNPGHLKSYTV